MNSKYKITCKIASTVERYCNIKSVLQHNVKNLDQLLNVKHFKPLLDSQ